MIFDLASLGGIKSKITIEVLGGELL